MATSRQIVLIFLTGVLGCLMYPSVFFGIRFPDMGFFAWIYLVPLLLLLNSAPRYFKIKTFASFFILFTGVLYFLVYAISNFGGVSLPISVAVLLLLVAIEAGFCTLGLWAATTCFKRTGIPLFVCLPVFLSSMDLLRMFYPTGGFPWGMPAYSQGAYLSFFQWADVTGPLGLNFLIYLINGLLFEIVSPYFFKTAKDLVINRGLFLVLLVLFSFAANLYRNMLLDTQAVTTPTTVALVQGNVEQDMKWDPKKSLAILDKYLELTMSAVSKGSSLVLWPETAYPFSLDLDAPAFLIPERFNFSLPLLVGAVSERSETLFNSAFLLEPSHHLAGAYHKRHLVPFGEYIPFKRFLSFASALTEDVGQLSPGSSSAPLVWDKLKLGILICYEDIFTDLARTEVLSGANVLVNISNDAWYGNSSAQYQHLVYSQLRALENRRELARVTNTGVTAFIDARGKVVSLMQPFTKGVLIGPLQPREDITFYTRHGDWIGWMSLALAVIFMIPALLRRIKNV